jgi:hypothetical protein
MGTYSKVKQVYPSAIFFSMLELNMTRPVLMHKGKESQAVVKFASYQKLPLEKRKVDSRNATIDQGTS